MPREQSLPPIAPRDMLASQNYRPRQAGVEEFHLPRHVRRNDWSQYYPDSQQVPGVELSGAGSASHKPRVILDCHSRFQTPFGFGNVVMIRRSLEGNGSGECKQFPGPARLDRMRSGSNQPGLYRRWFQSVSVDATYYTRSIGESLSKRTWTECKKQQYWEVAFAHHGFWIPSAFIAVHREHRSNLDAGLAVLILSCCLSSGRHMDNRTMGEDLVHG